MYFLRENKLESNVTYFMSKELPKRKTAFK